MTQKGIERKSLVVSAIANCFITGAGVWVFAVTQINALFLDCFFSLIGLISSIVAVIISKASKKKTRSYPDGIYFLEPLYAFLKSLLTLTLLSISVVATSITAYKYFAYGTGIPMNIGPVLPYTISMVILCFSLGFFNRAQNKKINNISTILTAESKSNFIDGLQSLGIGIAIVFLNIIDVNGPLGFLHYTGDFFITIILVLISLKQPIEVLITSFREFSNGTTNNLEIRNNINKIINVHLDNIIQRKQCDIFKVGMHLNVRISLPDGISQDTVLKLIEAKQKILNDLRKTYDSLKIDFVF